MSPLVPFRWSLNLRSFAFVFFRCAGLKLRSFAFVFFRSVVGFACIDIDTLGFVFSESDSTLTELCKSSKDTVAAQRK